MVETIRHGQDTAPEVADRAWARARVERKHKLRGDLVAYVVINAALVVTWMVTGFGSFWPGWILGIWGVFILLDVLNLYVRRPITEHEIEQELRKGR
jgi:cobalamin biosynthesis protein CobD/CbiB